MTLVKSMTLVKNMKLVKICGVNAAEAFDAVVEAGADYLGFVFFERSPRFVTAVQAQSLSARHDGGPKRVGLFVEPSAAEIRAVLDVVKLDVLQIYGDAHLCRAMREEFAVNVWRAVGVTGRDDLPVDTEGLDGFIIEAKAPPGATGPGGNATILDWGVLEGWAAPAPWFLGGGLNGRNIMAALKQTKAPGVDVSSGVETAPGVKSAALIKEFIVAVRAASV